MPGWDELRGHKWFRWHGEARAFWFRMLALLLAYAATLQTIPLTAEQVRVRHMEGLMHGFLALRTLDGKRLAVGEMTQIAEGDRVTSRLIFALKMARSMTTQPYSRSEVLFGF